MIEDSLPVRARNGLDLTTGWILVPWLILGTTVLWLYTPWSARPYDVVDFFDFLPPLRASTSFGDAFSRLTALYADQGRLNVVGYALISIKWSLFGEEMLGWQLVRFAEMCLACLLLYRVLCALRASRTGAFVATGLFVASPSAATNWLRLTAGEAAGSLLILVLMLLLLRSTDRTATLPTLVLLAVTTLAIGLVKELLLSAVIVPAIVLRQLTEARSDRGLRSVLRSTRLWAVASGGIIASVPVLYVALRAPGGSYAGRYGFEAVDAATTLMPLVVTLVPFAADDGFTGPAMAAAAILFLLVLVIGWGVLLSPGNRTGERALLFGLGIGLPLSGALIYAPWPAYALMYALPFQIGTAVLLAFAITAVHRSRATAWALSVALLLPLAVMVSYAQNYSRFIDRSLRMTRDLAAHIGSLPPDRPIRLEICPELRPARWAGYGSILVRYAESLGRTAPPIHAGDCSIPLTAASPARIALSDTPVTGADLARSHAYEYRTMDWVRLRPQPRALVVTTFGLAEP